MRVCLVLGLAVISASTSLISSICCGRFVGFFWQCRKIMTMKSRAMVPKNKTGGHDISALDVLDFMSSVLTFKQIKYSLGSVTVELLREIQSKTNV